MFLQKNGSWHRSQEVPRKIASGCQIRDVNCPLVTLLKPWHLWLLVAVGALAALYVGLVLRRRSYAARYASPAMIGLVAPKRTVWRRNLAAGVMLAALAVAVVGLARPARAERVARKEATVMLAIDVSPSMEATDVSPSRLVAAQRAASDFVRQP